MLFPCLVVFMAKVERARLCLHRRVGLVLVHAPASAHFDWALLLAEAE